MVSTIILRAYAVIKMYQGDPVLKDADLERYASCNYYYPYRDEADDCDTLLNTTDC